MSVALLFKEPDQLYEKVFEEGEWVPLFISPLRFEKVNGDILEKTLRNCVDERSGLVLTSPRAVEACAAVVPKQIFQKWSRKPVFTVGPATERKAFRLLGLSSVGSECGNAERLSELITSKINDLEAKSLFFPAGNLKREILPEKLKLAGIPLDALTVYETAVDPMLEKHLKELKSDRGLPSVLVFFSPSGVDSVVPILNDIPCDFASTNIVAIGPTTATQIQKWNLNVFGIASTPTPESILQILKQIC